MPFTANDFHDLVRLLAEHPEWRADLRRLVLSEELLGLPDLLRDLAHEVRELAAAQQRAEERLARVEEGQARLEARQDRLEAAMAALVEAQQRTEERLARVEERMSRLEDGQARLEAALAALAEAQRRTEEQVAALVEAQRRHEAEFAAFQVRAEERFGDLTGWVLVERFRNRAPAYLRAVVRRARVLLSHEVAQFVEDAEERGVLKPAEADDVLEADAVIAGRSRTTGERVHVVVEVSAVVDRHDVERAWRRAQALAKLHPAVPLAWGKTVTKGASEVAEALGVVIVRDGSLLGDTEG